jgi:Translation initiation factor 2 (IF-2; GTPase)
LKVGDVVFSDMSMGWVEAITNSSGGWIEPAGPSSAVEVLGLDTAPNAGSSFPVVSYVPAARGVIDFRDS